MKNFTFLAFIILISCFSSEAQRKTCVTDEVMRELFNRDPKAKLRFEKNRQMLDEKLMAYLSNPNARLNRVNAIINIPVVAHIILPNPALVTDATVQSQLDTLNWFYGNQSLTDSLRTYTPFRTTYGRSQIRFCLAQRTPAGLATNGIDRVTSGTTFSLGGAHPSTVAPAWNPQAYLNMWVVNFPSNTVLGYSYLPGTFSPTDQRNGYVCDYRAFGSGASYLFAAYNQGKTAVHEIGHYFNLEHPWGGGNANNAACSQDDGCGDTPKTSGPTFGCPTTIPVLNTCAPAAPGVMWQNHMDYADDACMVLFTQNQVTRMELALNTSPDRQPLTTSNSCQSVIPVPNDAGISAILTPVTAYVTCSATSTPQLTLRNFGSNNLTSVTITATVNGVAQAGYPFAWTGLLAPGASINLNVPVINLATGNNTVVFATTQPNGVADGSTSNDSRTTLVSRAATIATPVTEGFESPTFPPSNWFLLNPNGDFTWQRTTPGRNNSAGKASINNYDVDGTNNVDDLISPNITVNPASAYALSFDIAHKNYPNPTYYDILTVSISTNCGQTFTQVYSASGPALATAGSSDLTYPTPAAGDWVTRTVNIPSALLASGQIQVLIRNTSKFGNWIHLDNINISQLGGRDLRLVSINTPGTSSCSSNIIPSVTIANDGTEAITSFKVGYRINTGANAITTFTQTIAPGATATLILPASLANSGANTITAFTADPVSVSGTGDGKTSNDTLAKAFTVVALRSLPVVEGFETTFPPAGWTVLNPNANGTWLQATPGRNSTYSAFIDNYTVFGLTGQIDEIRSPSLNVAGADSVVVTFDVAHRQYPGASDSLSVLISADCGNTFNYVYSKGGATLATGPTYLLSYIAPTAAEWRTERLSLGGAAIASGSLGLNFRNRNAYGNNIFIDNINISGVFKRDLQLVSLNGISSFVCTASVTPTATIRNVGTETVTAFKVSYTINGGGLQTQTVTGVSLARNAQTIVTLPVINTSAVGVYNLRVFSFDPVTISGTGDQVTVNDTLSRTYSVAGTVTAPLVEAFTSTTFPPANWGVANPDNGITWSRNNIGNGNAGSAFVNTFNYNAAGAKDDLATPIISFGTFDSAKLSFDLSAVTYSYPGSTAIAIDTLEVLLTRDCGNTFTAVYKKWGNELQTINDPNTPQTGEFFPSSPNQWRRETIDLSTLGVVQSPLQFIFRVTNSSENNIFIDNVNFATQTLPALLKQQGYLVYPTAFRNSFTVRHYQTPSNLKFINVVNSIGQTVFTRQFNGSTNREISIDLTGKAAGVYLVEVGYMDANKNVVQKITKY